jgi:hypothetical protein
MGQSNLAGIAIAAAILVATAGFCLAQEPSLDPTASKASGFDLQLGPYAQGIPESPYLKNAEYRLLPEDDSVPPQSFLYPFRADYVLWEEAPADSTPLTEEGGTLLYPLVEVDFGGRLLPILLYVPALHSGSPNPRY